MLMMKRVDSRTKNVYDEEEPELEDCDVAEMILTYIFEKLHFRSAETLLFNEAHYQLNCHFLCSRGTLLVYLLMYEYKTSLNANVLRF